MVGKTGPYRHRRGEPGSSPWSFYRDILGMELHGTETVEEQKVRVAFFPVGDTELELLESTDPEGPIAKFIAAKGQGIQHLAFSVEDIEKALAELKAQGRTADRRKAALRRGRRQDRLPAPQGDQRSARGALSARLSRFCNEDADRH